VIPITVILSEPGHAPDHEHGDRNGADNRRTAMNTIIKTIRVLSVATAVAISMTSFAAHAIEATAEQRRACTPDAFRLCSAHIPNVDAIITCMSTNRSKLSPACREAFDKAAPAAQTKVATSTEKAATETETQTATTQK
jgi:hypothetical protein